MESREWHPAACIFPLMDADELDELARDIEANGLQVPIILHPDGRVLDGRNRVAACTIAKVEAQFETREVADPLAFVFSTYEKRRQLSSGQRAAAYVKAEQTRAALATEASARKQAGRRNLSQKVDQGPNGRKADAIGADLFGTNRQYVAEAKRIEAADPILLDEVHAGKKTIR